MDIRPFILIVALILLSAFFSGSEIAFAAVNKLRLKKLAESGNASAKTALYVHDHFDFALPTILIGNNLVNIGAASVATVLATRWLGAIGAVYATLIMTVLILTFGEITPKTIAKKQCDGLVLIIARPLRLLMIVLKPFSSVIVHAVQRVSQIWGSADQNEPSITEEELVSLIESVTDDGVIDEDRSELLQSALEFSDITAEEILTPRTDMLVLDIDEDLDTMKEIALSSPYSRIPVYEGSVDNIIGILHLGHFLKELVDDDQVDIRGLLIDAYFVHQTMKLPKIFSELKKRQLHMAVVTDEHGGTMGCITMEDILEELVGDIWDESDEITNDFVHVGDNTYEVSGDLPLYDFLEYVNIDERYFESDYTTVGGWTIERLNGFPSVYDSFEYDHLTVTVIALDGLRVERLLVQVAPAGEEYDG